MYQDLMKFPLRHDNLKWEAREALLEVDGRPHLYVRVKLTGTKFPMLAQIPRVWIGNVFATHVEIDEDGLAVRAYFAELPSSGNLYFGHGRNPELDFGKVDASKVGLLDRKRLPQDVVLTERRPVIPQ